MSLSIWIVGFFLFWFISLIVIRVLQKTEWSPFENYYPLVDSEEEAFLFCYISAIILSVWPFTIPFMLVCISFYGITILFLKTSNKIVDKVLNLFNKKGKEKK